MESQCSNVFQGISDADCKHMMECFEARRRQYGAGQTICEYNQGSPLVGILESGSASLIRIDVYGVRTILETLSPGEMFGEALAFAGLSEDSMAVICDKDASVLFFEYSRIIHPCSNTCTHHTQLIENIFRLMAQKSMALSERVEVLSRRTIRDKLLCYFSLQASPPEQRRLRPALFHQRPGGLHLLRPQRHDAGNEKYEAKRPDPGGRAQDHPAALTALCRAKKPGADAACICAGPFFTKSACRSSGPGVGGIAARRLIRIRTGAPGSVAGSSGSVGVSGSVVGSSGSTGWFGSSGSVVGSLRVDGRVGIVGIHRGLRGMDLALALLALERGQVIFLVAAVACGGRVRAGVVHGALLHHLIRRAEFRGDGFALHCTTGSPHGRCRSSWAPCRRPPGPAARGCRGYRKRTDPRRGCRSPCRPSPGSCRRRAWRSSYWAGSRVPCS